MRKNIINGNMAVITLPMKPHRNEKIGMIVIPSLADMFSKRIGAKSYLGINLMDSYINRENFVNDYYNLLYQMNIDFDEVWIDNSNKSKLMENVNKLKEKGYIQEKEMKLLRCPCGVIDMKREGANNFVTKRSYEVKGNEIFCKECGEKCIELIDKVLVFNSGNLEIESITIPTRISKEKREFNRKFKGQDILISRKRDTKNKIDFNGTQYNIDIDFLTLNYLSCFNEEKRIVIGSNHHIYQMYMMELFESCLESKSENLYIAVPYVRTPENYPFDLKSSLFALNDYARALYIFSTAFRFKNTTNSWLTNMYEYFKNMNIEDAKKLYHEMTVPQKMQEGISLRDYVTNSVNNTNIQRMLKTIKDEKEVYYEKL